MKTYVVCIDGTWNHPEQRDADPIDPGVEMVTETNVFRVYRFLTGALHRGSKQPEHGMVGPLKTQSGEVQYLSGVGSAGGWIQKAWDGATGIGTAQKIQEAYRFLAERWQPEDRIFGFGFSRGAFAVRSLAGLINFAGLPGDCAQRDMQWCKEIYLAYEAQDRAACTSRNQPATVQFLGLWDTVSALAFGAGRRHDISPPNVCSIAHALALDERRSEFAPEYWVASSSATVDEVWFAGAHSNIGGGYRNQELSNIPLAWMVSKAVKAGLSAQGAYIQGWYGENAIGRARDSHAEFLNSLWILRSLAKKAPLDRKMAGDHGIHASVFDRWDQIMADYSNVIPSHVPSKFSYVPSARMADGRPIPPRSDYVQQLGRIVETPDYLDQPQA